jgi:ATP-binding cassette subfamily B multidrug efflux pump
LAVVGFLSTMVCQVFAVKVSSSFGCHVRNDMYKQIDTFSLKEYDRFSSSSLETRLSSDVVIAQKGLTLLLRLAIRAPFLVIGSIIMAFVLSPANGWIFILVGVLLGLVIWLITSLSVPYNTKIQRQLDKVTTISDDNLEGTRVVRAFNKEEYERKRFYQASDDLEVISKRLAFVSSFLNPLNSLIVNAGIILILFVGAKNLSSSTAFLTPGDIVALVNYMNQISMAIVVVANLVQVFSKASSSSKRISEVLETKTTIAGGQAKPDFSSENAVTFENVTFHYNPASAPALEQISFQAKKGQTIGIIGGTGSGKTTLVDLLDRFYDPDQGKIQVAGVDLKDFDLDYLREKIGYVNQRSVLFSGTIRSNLLMGNQEASEATVSQAIAVSQSADIIKTRKEGLEAEVSQGGKNYSGGQKQRLSIARALVKNPPILILDDSSSALDFHTDYELRKAIKENLKGTTVFIVSQRVSSLNDADQILVLDKGRLAGLGTKDSLYRTCPVFKEIVDSQTHSEEKEAQA